MSDTTAELGNSSWIRIRGARTHNLQGIDVDLPTEKLIVVTGVSGSGKSSLAFDTLFAEGRRRYLSTVSLQTRELIQRLERPDVDSIEGLPPTLGIEQRRSGPRRRTTLATIAEVYDLIRVLFARIGVLHCPSCHQPVSSQSRKNIVDQALQLGDRHKVVILSPMIRTQPGAFTEVFARIVRDGFVRARVDGEFIDAAVPPVLDASRPHSIETVIDRLIIKDGIRSRLEESIELALELGQGECILSHEDGGQWQDRLFSSRLACSSCRISLPAFDASDFSFNSARGACPACHGLGQQLLNESSELVQAGGKKRAKDRDRQDANELQTDDIFTVCSACDGSRLARHAKSILITGRSISDIVGMRIDKALAEVASIAAIYRDSVHSENPTGLAARHILPEIQSRLQFLVDVGLDYLTLDRAGDSLSSGEFQRARLAASLGSQMDGACYVIDEPTAGLHPRDTSRLLQILRRLQEQGNTLVVVEHDLDLIQRADYVIDIGPGAGQYGGRLLSAGPLNEIVHNESSITGGELRRRATREPFQTESIQPQRWLTLSGATLHNLKDVTLRLPLGLLVCVTGVSGSGKSSLIMKTLVPAVRCHLNRTVQSQRPFAELHGVDQISRLVRIDQRPLGRTGRSTPATSSGIWNEIRQLFAKTREARLRGYSARRFSLHNSESCCARCSGRGEIALADKSLFDWSTCCSDCNGLRFNKQTLSIRYRGHSVSDVLEMSFETAAAFFANLPRLSRSLSLFCELGLGYLKLGQPSQTLSGGEAQRVKLAAELATSVESLPTLFVLDEPTSGLHPSDVRQLLQALKRLVAAGHSVVVVEHNLELISTADWIIDVGPEAGEGGGLIVAEGPPSVVALAPGSLTGIALRATQHFATTETKQPG